MKQYAFSLEPSIAMNNYFFQGVSAEGLCRAIRSMPSLRQLAHDYSLTVLCGIHANSRDTIEVAIVSIMSV